MKYYLLTAAVLFNISSVYAQQSWKRSWCVTQKGDTLHGQILFEDWEISPSQIVFRDTLNQTQRTFGTTELKSFGLRYNKRDEIFESKTVQVTTFSRALVEYGKPPFSVDTISRFIELRFHSDVVSLFELSDVEKMPHFYIMKNHMMTELEYGKATLIKDDKPYAYKNNRYKIQLKGLLQECPTLDVNEVNYTNKSLVKLLTEYHSFCKVDYSVLFSNKSRVKVNLGITGGVYFIVKGAPYYPLDASVRFLMPKKFYNRFLSIEVGMSGLWLNAGSYFGKDTNKFFPLTYVGFLGPIPNTVGVGVSWRKKLDFSVVGFRIPPGIGFRLRYYPTIRKNSGR